MGYLNIGQMLFVVIALILPIYCLVKTRKNWAFLSIISLSFAGVSLCLRLLYNDYLVHIEDWSALMDISNITTIISVVLFVFVMSLNSIVYHKNKSRN